jgi:tRNA acetyltransferase TAN1
MESISCSLLFSICVTLQVPEPVQLVHHIMKDLESTKKQKTRFLLRLLPIEATCKVCIQQVHNFK